MKIRADRSDWPSGRSAATAGRRALRSGWRAVAVLLAFVFLLAGCADPLDSVLSPAGGADATQSTGASTGAGGDESSTAAATTGADDNEGIREEGAVEKDDLHAIVAAHNGLGLRLHAALAEKSEGNVFISPSSIALALSMAHNGARGETAEAMARAMQMAGLDLRAINEAHRRLLETYAAGEDALGVRLHIANSLWHRDTFVPGETFLDAVTRYYRGIVRGLDFADPASVSRINDWVEERTEGLITDLVESLDDDLVALLINTVYFKGMWTTPFDAAFTQDLEFRADGDSRLVPFMYRDGRFDHRRGDDFEAVRLPYGEDGRMAMYVFLPDEGTDLGAFVAGAEAEDLFVGFDNKFGEVRLPKMDLEYKAKLNDVLKALGMEIAFTPGRADFSGLTESGSGGGEEAEGGSPTGEGSGNDDRAFPTQSFYIGEVVHQSVLKVDEEGTEAAAATSIGIRLTSMPTYEFRFTADRPFFVAIRDDATGALLFVGSIANPKDA